MMESGYGLTLEGRSNVGCLMYNSFGYASYVFPWTMDHGLSTMDHLLPACKLLPDNI